MRDPVDPTMLAKWRELALDHAATAHERLREAEARAATAEDNAAHAPNEELAQRHRQEAALHRRAAELQAKAHDDFNEAAAVLDVHRAIGVAIESGDVRATERDAAELRELRMRHIERLVRHVEEEAAIIEEEHRRIKQRRSTSRH
jgi:cysteinyl-tRNA synthetase